MTSDSTMRLRFTAQTLSEFWLGVEREHPLIGQRAVSILLPILLGRWGTGGGLKMPPPSKVGNARKSLRTTVLGSDILW